MLRLSMAQPELNPLKLELTLAAVNGKTSFLVKMDATSVRGHVDANCTATISFTIGALDHESAIHIKPTKQEPLYVVGFEIVPDLRARA